MDSVDQGGNSELDLLPVAVLRSNGRGRVEYANVAAKLLCGPDVLGREVKDVYYGDEQDLPGPIQIRQALAQAKNGILTNVAINIRRFGGGSQRILACFRLHPSSSAVTSVMVAGAYELQEAVSRVATSLTHGTNIDDVLQRIADETRPLCRADRVYFGLHDSSRQILEYKALSSTRPEDQFPKRTSPTDEGLNGRVFSKRSTQRTGDVAADGSKQACCFEDTASQIAVPLLYSGPDGKQHCFGVLAAEGSRPNQFGADTEFILDTLAKHAAIGIAQHSVLQEVRNDYESILSELRVAQDAWGASNLVHDAKNVLRHAISQLQDIEKPGAPQKKLASMAETIDQLTVASDILTDVAKALKSKKLELEQEPEPVDLYRMASRLVRMSVPADGIQIVLEPREGSGMVMGVPQRLMFMIFNLVRNSTAAILNSDKKRGTITIGVLDSPERKGFCRLVVHDDGPGMERSMLDLVHRRVSVSALPGGSGIGLISVRETVLGLGGHIDVQSKFGKFTRFIIDLPAA